MTSYQVTLNYDRCTIVARSFENAAIRGAEKLLGRTFPRGRGGFLRVSGDPGLSGMFSRYEPAGDGMTNCGPTVHVTKTRP